ncbi:MAG: KpsF/GutQ family sugar-phosphate isomerase [SAR86 cluster bacterium]|uniref:Arabinose 5-phosphate isomerase n=1 Tax=SAR86 cluster bacterium TaxID=2030880 RepID=A0A937IBF9_9GAMM|nr:KpsF/GutQ family sugar-phosphate isomerase [SAR86 cluster bacterium]
MKKINFQKEAKKALLIELDELKSFIESKSFKVNKFCEDIFNCKGKVFLTGVGKSGHIANKIAATLSSTGTPSFFIHPAEALHGDLGMIQKKDLLIAISKSGESKEIVELLPAIKNLKIKLLSITENSSSSIGLASDTHIEVKVTKEACPNGLAPTSSTTVTLALGDSIAVAILKARKFSEKDFAKSHPGGKLGRKLTLKISDVMTEVKNAPLVDEELSIRKVLIEISKKKQGFALITRTNDKHSKIIGIFSDGDLRRNLEKKIDIDNANISQVMTKSFKTIESNLLVAHAAKFMQKNKIYNLVVKENGVVVGFLTMHQILESNVL